MNLNFKKIFLIGVDHSWHEDVILDEDNILYTKNQHFYDKEIQKLMPFVFDMKTGVTAKMHEFFYSFYLVFRGHILLEKYSKILGSKIYNFSKKTFVDAYERYDGKENK